MRKYVLLLIGLAFWTACEKEEAPSNPELCAEEYFYYSGGSKIFLKHSLNRVWIVFNQGEITGAVAKSILGKYAFIHTDNLSDDRYYKQIMADIHPTCDCAGFKNYLKELNRDNEIGAATPVFYTSENTPDAYWILLSEVLTAHNEANISEPEFISYAETLNLELVKSRYSSQHFKIHEVTTGFEALEIANQIYESGKAQYSHPNFIAQTVLF